MTASLPPYAEDARCAKCGYDAIHTRYEGRLHRGCSASGAYDSYLMVTSFGVGMTKEDGAEWKGYLDAVPDHLERECARCGRKWAEAIIEEAVPA